MHDPHVVSLQYKLETGTTVSFYNPPAVNDETDTFRLKLENSKVTVDLKHHFASVEAARCVVDAYLLAWELDVALRFGRKEIKFIFEDAEVIDRDPPPSGSPMTIQVSGIASATAFGTATISAARREYPSPPKYFRVNPDVDTLWHRFEGYSQGREPLLAMAYFCLTLLEARAGGRKNAEKQYRIQKAVLDKLGELTANRGDEKTARKLKKASPPAPLTPAEARRIEVAIKAIIWRVGEMGTNPSLAVIGMSDLPKI